MSTQRYILRDPREPQSHGNTSLQVLRTSDNTTYLANTIPTSMIATNKKSKIEHYISLPDAILPVAAKPISQILNHPNIISIVDIIRSSNSAGPTTQAGQFGDITVWEDMTAGSLAYILPNPAGYPKVDDKKAWDELAKQNFGRFSLPEGLCWHVLKSISKALLWLQTGKKGRPGEARQLVAIDEDWQPILMRDISPGQVWFKHVKGEETYGECKLGGFGWAKVVSGLGGTSGGSKVAGGDVGEGVKRPVASAEKQLYWAPEIYGNSHSWTQSSEIWSLGATIYTMMTGMPPPRTSSYDWMVSRMHDGAFSLPLIEIVHDMLKTHPSDRPSIVEVVERVEEKWRGWRATTNDGAYHIDTEDKIIEAMLAHGGQGC